MDRSGLGLLVATFVIATAGLVYELIAGAAASYLLGDSVTQFSLVIGTYLFAMGIGSYLSRFIEAGVPDAPAEPRRPGETDPALSSLLTWFVRIEMAVGLLGGFSAVMLFATFARDGAFQVVLFLLVGGVGIGVGAEIPLLVRILEGRMALKDLIARVLFFDYLGALAASVAFPLFLVPRLGLVNAGLLLGMLNVAVGVALVIGFRTSLRRPWRLLTESLIALAVLLFALLRGDAWQRSFEADLFPDPVVFATSSPYQRIVVTRSRGGETRLFLNGHLQFSSTDEYRYHEALVHPVLAAAPRGRPLSALVLGGGDGMAVRELLTDPDVKAVHLVDLDGEMTDLFRDHSDLAPLNGLALSDPRVTIENADAFAWVNQHADRRYDVVIVDFPDPSSYGVGKLYTTTFYARLARLLTPDSVVAVQSTSPYSARRAFWCIDATMREVGFRTHPFHVHVPSFGEWGYVLAKTRPFDPPIALRSATRPRRYLNDALLASLFAFPEDMERPLPDDGESAPINRLNDQVLVRLYDEDWGALK